MTEPIRVLHVFGALDSGGVSNFVMNAYRQLDRTQVQFDFAMTSGKTGLFDEQVQAMGGRIFYFDPARSLLDNLQYVLRKNGPFAAVHSHVFFYSGLVLRAAKRAVLRPGGKAAVGAVIDMGRNILNHIRSLSHFEITPRGRGPLRVVGSVALD